MCFDDVKERSIHDEVAPRQSQRLAVLSLCLALTWDAFTFLDAFVEIDLTYGVLPGDSLQVGS